MLTLGGVAENRGVKDKSNVFFFELSIWKDGVDTTKMVKNKREYIWEGVIGMKRSIC